MSGHELSELLSDAEVKAVLARAAEIERTGGAVSVAELERAAVEAGIDSAALMKAVEEVLARRSGAAIAVTPPAQQTKKQSWYRRFASTIGTALTAITGFWTGVAAEAIGDGGWAVLALWLLVASSLLMTGAYRRRGGSGHELQTRLLALWASFITGFSLMEGSVDEAAGVFMSLWLVCAAIAAMVMWKSPRSGNDAGPDSSTANQ